MRLIAVGMSAARDMDLEETRTDTNQPISFYIRRGIVGLNSLWQFRIWPTCFGKLKPDLLI